MHQSLSKFSGARQIANYISEEPNVRFKLLARADLAHMTVPAFGEIQINVVPKRGLFGQPVRHTVVKYKNEAFLSAILRHILNTYLK